MKQKLTWFGLLTFCLMLIMGPAFAQTPNDPNNPAAPSTIDDGENDYGWVGLLGLIGLAGLLGRKRDVHVTNKDVGMPRSAAR
jgi:LPXTG-motif cell wall-anchored protein